ncbi:MAG: hypothetical protein ACT4OI_10320 [Methanobacteriota archaeon]
MDALVEALRADLRLEAEAAAVLAARARRFLPRLTHSDDDSTEDLVVRLRDPRLFGELAVHLLDDAALPPTALRAVVEHAFDLLPLPHGEHDAFAVGARAPGRLLGLARSLIDADAFTVLHFLHLLYAIFLDRSLVRSATRADRSRVLAHALAQDEFTVPLRTLYAALHLTSVPEPEAHAELRRLLASDRIPRDLRERLARIATAEDGGRAELTGIAKDEGLLASEAMDPTDPVVLANVPRLPERLRAPARRWLAASAADSR